MREPLPHAVSPARLACPVLPDFGASLLTDMHLAQPPPPPRPLLGRYVRHPSYMAYFWWAVGSQIMLANPVMGVLFALYLWRWFFARIGGASLLRPLRASGVHLALVGPLAGALPASAQPADRCPCSPRPCSHRRGEAARQVLRRRVRRVPQKGRLGPAPRPLVGPATSSPRTPSAGWLRDARQNRAPRAASHKLSGQGGSCSPNAALVTRQPRPVVRRPPSERQPAC